MDNPMNLSGKHVLVTGASQGIGAAVAVKLSQLGAKISLVARNEKKLNDRLDTLKGKKHNIFPFDLTNIEDIEQLVTQIVSEAGTLNGLVHCAGIADFRPIAMNTHSFIHNVMLINFYAYIELLRCCSKKKNFVPPASFVAISSAAAQVGEKSKLAYCASKSALDSATRCAARELSSKGIRVNTVAPSFIKTEIYEQYIASVGDDSLEQSILAKQYLGIGEPIDIANAVAYLLSDAAKFITGTAFVVDGGYLS